MPAKGGGLAILKWVTSFPGNPRAGLPVVMGLICVSSAEDGQPLALVDVAPSPRCAPAPSRRSRLRSWRREDARSAGIVGCGLHGAWAARCLAAAEYGPGVCFDPDPEAAGRLAGELGWEAGTREDALACDVVTCVTPGHRARRARVRPAPRPAPQHARGRRPGQGRGGARRVAAAELFCDEWEQASHGGELTGAVEAGLVGRADVRDLGGVLTGAGAGPLGPEAVTLFDSTGLAIQDLAICLALLGAHRAGRVDARTVSLLGFAAASPIRDANAGITVK